MIVFGLDPGLRFTGWGIISYKNSNLKHIGNGTIKSNSKCSLGERLVQIHQGISDILEEYKPDTAAVEETFVNKNPSSTLKLGAARGVVLLAPAQFGLQVHEYTPNQIKKTVVGVGHADKEQIKMMVNMLLPNCGIDSDDSADALAVAICHAHHYHHNLTYEGKKVL